MPHPLPVDIHPSNFAFPLYLVGVGIVALIGFLPSTMRAHASLRWPRTIGRVRSNQDELATVGELIPAVPGAMVEEEQMPVVDYDYTVNGKTFRGCTLYEPGPASLLRLIHEDELRPGQTIPVSYDPREHSISVLYPGASPFAYLILGAGIAILVAGLIVLVHAL